MLAIHVVHLVLLLHPHHSLHHHLLHHHFLVLCLDSQPLLLFDYSAVVAQLVPLLPLPAVVLAHGGDGDAAVVVDGVIVANWVQRKDIAVGGSCVREALLLLEYMWFSLNRWSYRCERCVSREIDED